MPTRAPLIRRRDPDPSSKNSAEKDLVISTYGKRSPSLLLSTIPLGPIFNLRLLYRLPLHLRWNVRTTAFERDEMIDDVTLPAPALACLLRDCISNSHTCLDLA